MPAPTLEEILRLIAEKFQAAPDAATLVTDPGPAAQHSLLLAHETAVEVARFLRDAPELRFDFCSNVTGIDRKAGDSADGFLEAVYHLYSVARKTAAPLILRLRTASRATPKLDAAGKILDATGVTVPSLTPVWPSCEFQEREAYDLFGIVFTGHPDLRRLLMWDEFQDFPMRKDYAEPDDYEWEPTPHAAVLKKASHHYPAAPAAAATPETAATPVAAAPSAAARV